MPPFDVNTQTVGDLLKSQTGLNTPAPASADVTLPTIKVEASREPPPSPPGVPPPVNTVPQNFFATIGDQLRAAQQGLPTMPGSPPGPAIPPELFVPPPQPQPWNPMNAWASNAMVFAALASLLTRTPLTTAINAAAGVLKGNQEGNQAATAAAFNNWKTSTGAAARARSVITVAG